MAFCLVKLRWGRQWEWGQTILILHLLIDSLIHAYKFHHLPGVSKPRHPIPMATQKVFGVVLFVLLGLGICSATRALFTYEKPDRIFPTRPEPHSNNSDYGDGGVAQEVLIVEV